MRTPKTHPLKKCPAMTGRYVLGLDPGLAHFGIALVELATNEEHDRLAELDLVVTEKSSKKQNVLASGDCVRRTRIVAERLAQVMRSRVGSVVAVCMEAMSFPRSSSAAAKMALARGTAIALAHHFGIPILEASPQEVKLAATGSRQASKYQVEIALGSAWRGFEPMIVKFNKGDREHPSDALAVVMACSSSDVVRMARTL